MSRHSKRREEHESRRWAPDGSEVVSKTGHYVLNLKEILKRGGGGRYQNSDIFLVLRHVRTPNFVRKGGEGKISGDLCDKYSPLSVLHGCTLSREKQGSHYLLQAIIPLRVVVSLLWKYHEEDAFILDSLYLTCWWRVYYNLRFTC